MRAKLLLEREVVPASWAGATHRPRLGQATHLSFPTRSFDHGAGGGEPLKPSWDHPIAE